MFIVGHTLVWHNQTPPWFFTDSGGKPNTPAAQAERLRSHIEAVAGRYKGRIHAWDVVNEVIGDDGNYRPTTWVRGIGNGDRLVTLAFRYAAQYAPNTELYYNDFNAWRPAKRDGIVRLVRMLQKQGIRIDGVGMQGHWGLNYPETRNLKAAMDSFAATGVKVIITELNVDVLPVTKEGQVIGQSFAEAQWQNEEFRKFLDPYATGLPEDVQEQLTARYEELFRDLLAQARQARPRDFLGRARRPVVEERLSGAGADELSPALRPQPSAEAGVPRGARGAALGEVTDASADRAAPRHRRPRPRPLHDASGARRHLALDRGRRARVHPRPQRLWQVHADQDHHARGYPLARQGSARILGRDRWNVVELRTQLGIVSPDLLAACSTEATGRDVVLSGFFSSTRIFPHHSPDPVQAAHADELLARFGVAHLADVRWRACRRGGKRVLIARALVHDPSSLLFDEPGNALDVAAHAALVGTMSQLARGGIWRGARHASRRGDHPGDRAGDHAARGARLRRTGPRKRSS